MKFFVVSCLFVFLSFWASSATITWNGTMAGGGVWENTLSWSPAQIPTSTDDVVINGTTNTLTFTGTKNIRSLTITSGTLTGDILTTSSIITINGGTLNAILLSMPSGGVSYTCTNGNINSDLSIFSQDLFLNGGTYNGTVEFTKTGGTTNTCLGGGTYSGSTMITNSGSGDLLLGSTNPDSFNTLQLNNNSNNASIGLAEGSVGNYCAALSIDNDMGSGPSNLLRTVHISRYSGATISIDLLMSTNNLSSGVFFGDQGGSTTINGAIDVYSTGGTLSFKNTTFTTMALITNGNFTDDATLIFGPNSSTTDVNVTVPNILLNGCVFNTTTTLIKTGNNNNTCEGGNTFLNSFFIQNQGDGDFIFGNSNPDIFNGNGTLLNAGNGRILVADNSSGNTISGTLILDNGAMLAPGTRSIHVSRNAGATFSIEGSLRLNNNNSSGIFFGENGGSSTLTNMGTFQTDGFVNGTLLFAGLEAYAPILFDVTGTTGSLIFGPNSTFHQMVQSQTCRLYLNGAIFENSYSFTKTGAGNDLSVGGNIFTNASSGFLVNNGSGDLVLGTTDPDQFLGNMTMYNFTSSNQLRIAESSTGNVISGLLILDNGTMIAPGTRTIHVSRNTGATLSIEGSIRLNNNNSGGIFFGENGGSSTLALMGAFQTDGFVNGTLLFAGLEAYAPILFDVTGTTGSLIFGPNSTFHQMVQSQTCRLFLNGATFENSYSLIKTGAGNDLSVGGNIFTNVSSGFVVNNGSGDLVLGTTDPDQFLGNMTMYNFTSSNQLRIAESSNGNVISGLLILDNGTMFAPGTRSIHVSRNTGATLSIEGSIRLNNNNSGGIFFGENGGSSTLTNMGAFQTDGFVNGTLLWAGLETYAPIFFNVTGTTGSLIYGPSSTFYQMVQTESCRLYLNGSTFESSYSLIKTGAGNDLSDGGNIFSSVSNGFLVNNGSGDLVLGTADPDRFLGSIAVYNFTSDNQLRLAESSFGNIISGQMTLNNGTMSLPGTRSIHITRETGSTATINANLSLENNGSSGIYFGENGGESTFNSGAMFGGAGFVDGVLLFKNTVHNSSNTINFLSGTASLIFGPSTEIVNGIDATTPRLFLNGAVMSGTCQFNKTGASDDYSVGSNRFTSSCTATIVNNSNGDLYLGNVLADTVQGILTLNPITNNDIYFAYNSPDNLISGMLNCDINTNGANTPRSIHLATASNATLDLTGTMRFDNNGSQGVFFGENGGNTVFWVDAVLGSQSGFAGGTLEMQNVISNKFATIDFLNSNAALKLGPNMVINEIMTAYAPQLFLNGVTTNANCTFVKLGSSNDLSIGGNVYNNPVILQNEGSGQLNLAGTDDDDYNNLLTIRNNATGNIDLSHTADALIFQNVVLDGFSTTVNGSNSGYAVFSGANNQTIIGTGGFNPQMGRVRMSKSNNDLTLLSPLDIVTEVDFITGRIFTTATNYLQFLDNAQVEPNNISNDSFVHGPVRKVGDDFFPFPVGKGTRYQPCAIDPPANVTDVFTGEYFPANSNALYPHASKVPSLNNISTCDYWIIDRTVGTSDVAVWLSWSSPNCNVMTNLSEVVIARWDGTMWQDHGQANVNGNLTDGYMSTASAVTSFSPFALASLTPNNPLPVELLDLAVEVINNEIVDISWSTSSEKNSDYFLVERTIDGINFEEIGTVAAAGNSEIRLEYQLTDLQPIAGISYYRLTQFDTDGTATAYPLQMAKIETEVLIYPNPIQRGELINVMSSQEQLSYSLFDQTGRILWDKVDQSSRILDLAPGTYFIHIESTNDGTIEVHQVIVK